MVGVTDLPFRELAWELGAGLVVGEMTSANPELWSSELSLRRRARGGDVGPHAVQIAGGDPDQIAVAAARAEASGAEIIDINMGCPAKKVCRKAAGSSLLKDESLVGRILEAAVRAVAVPVTVKIRTGWSPEQRNGVRIAQIAEAAGIVSIAVHGRTRACRFVGAVEYDTIAAIKRAVSIPVFANGDIVDVASARAVLGYTGADGLLIGRAALGAPWLPGDIARALATGRTAAPRSFFEVMVIVDRHVARLHEFYGASRAVGIVRKHVKGYFEILAVDDTSRMAFNAIDSAAEQRDFLAHLVTNRETARAA